MSKAKKVLIVDDDPDAVDITGAMLSEFEGVVTISANDGESGLRQAREAKPDLIILDVHMQGKSGFDVFHELKRDESTKDIPVIMLTAVEEKTGMAFSAEEMEEYLGSKPACYIEKPVKAETLQGAVSKLLGVQLTE